MGSDLLTQRWTEMSECRGTSELRIQRSREAWRTLFQICVAFLVCCIVLTVILTNLKGHNQPLTAMVIGRHFGQDLKMPNSTNLKEKLLDCTNKSTQKKWFNVKVNETARYTSTLLELLRANSTMRSACSGVATNSTLLEELPDLTPTGKYLFRADVVYYLTLVAIGTNGMRRCAGGDYYEVDLHDRDNLRYRSRLPTVDRGDGTYGLEIVVPSRFSGEFTLSIWLLFSNWHGLDHKTESWVKKTLMLTVDLDFVIDRVDRDRVNADQLESYVHHDKSGCNNRWSLMPLQRCTPADFSRNTWQGRWTRSWFNYSCEADAEKRFRCLPKEHYLCPEPWCFGPLSRLDSNGWHYSAHCSFRIFEPAEAWQCLNNRWIYVWGDSNFQDTIRNLLLFILDWELPRGKTLAKFQLERSYESTFYNPKKKEQSFRVSQHFNGATPPWIYGAGLKTLEHDFHQKLILSHFNGTNWPDTVIMNSGLHDGDQFDTVDEFAKSADYVVQWWVKLYNYIRADRKPLLIWRTTIAPAGISRKMNANPNKMEMFNQIVVEKLQEVEDILPVNIVDAFDLSFPFHYDNEYSDGGHYGRAPGYERPPWRGRPHWYFVDLMLAHILLNAACSTLS